MLLLRVDLNSNGAKADAEGTYVHRMTIQFLFFDKIDFKNFWNIAEPEIPPLAATCLYATTIAEGPVLRSKQLLTGCDF